MKPNNEIKNGMIVFDEPFDLGNGTILYGVLFNKEFEQIKEEEGNGISSYIEYLAGMSQIIRQGIPVTNGDADDVEKEEWIFPEYKTSLSYTGTEFRNLLNILFKDKVKYRSYIFDNPIVWHQEEVDEDTPELIVSPHLIHRYISKRKKKILDEDIYIKPFENNFNAIAVLDKEIVLDGHTIYGVMYNTRQEKMLAKIGMKHNIDDYILFSSAVDRWNKTGGNVSNDCTLWTHPESNEKLEADWIFNKIIVSLMAGITGFKKYEFDESIEWDKDDVVDIEPHLVINPELIERYTNINNQKEI